MLLSKDTHLSPHLPPEPHPKIFASALERLVDRDDAPYVTARIGRISWVPIIATAVGKGSRRRPYHKE